MNARRRPFHPCNPKGTCRLCGRPLVFRRGQWLDEEDGLPNCRAWQPHEPVPFVSKVKAS